VGSGDAAVLKMGLGLWLGLWLGLGGWMGKSGCEWGRG
jgi:hypothetical protein